ncbi:hypothetical protein DE146DRAFT_628146 [Phaeosphaeria sp. MPI-PUGE-AT-0046c]|nr:hypothetical protein DE146DRAFT_628146 [Phaeosphaeria sp. MPI-PUGE-AT-0046c]
MPQYLPNQIDDANLAYYYTAQETSDGLYYRLTRSNNQFPSGFYASQRSVASRPAVSQSAPSTASSLPTIALSVVIYIGQPLDYQKYRHTALCLRPNNGGTCMIIHTIGPNKRYVLETKDNYDPTTSRRFAKEASVATLKTPMSKSQLASIIYQTPIDNSSIEFNCQTWVGDALQRLATAGYITQDECDSGIDKMVDAVVEAKHEPE